MTPDVNRSKAIRAEAMRLVIKERFRQDEKWGIQRHSYPLYRVILGEELGEADQAYLQTIFGGPHGGLDALRNELVQAAAVSLAMLETILECDVGFLGAPGADANIAGKLWGKIVSASKVE
jgi:hypothetical protein